MTKTLQTNLVRSFHQVSTRLRPISGAVAMLVAAGLSLSAGQAQAQTAVYAQWPMTRNNQDSAAVRSAGITVGTPTFKKLVVSDNSAAATVPPYSALYGQAYAPVATGTGWSNTAPSTGPGGTLRRGGFYEQFTITAGTASVRVDSVVYRAGFLGTASSTNMSMAYSKSNFTADSAEYSGGKGPSGAIAGVKSGNSADALERAFPLSQVSLGSPTSNTYRLALNGATGVTLTSGQTLTIRLYNSCSSTGAAARFALLRNVVVKSTQVVTATAIARSKTPLTVYPNPMQDQLMIAHPAAKKGATVAVYTVTGQKAASQTAQPGTTSTDMHLSSLTSGIYLVEYSDGQQRITSKIVKQ